MVSFCTQPESTPDVLECATIHLKPRRKPWRLSLWFEELDEADLKKRLSVASAEASETGEAMDANEILAETKKHTIDCGPYWYSRTPWQHEVDDRNVLQSAGYEDTCRRR